MVGNFLHFFQLIILLISALCAIHLGSRRFQTLQPLRFPLSATDPELSSLKGPSGNYKHKDVFCIYFFGSHNFAWIPEDQLKPYLEFKEKFASSCKTATFKDAINKIEQYMKNGILEELQALENPDQNDKAEEGRFDE